MKRKKTLLLVGAVLVSALVGTLGTYSAWGSPKVGLTYRLNGWRGVKIKTVSGFGGELLLNYSSSELTNIWGGSESTTTTGFAPAFTYHFGESSPYVGLGYYSSTEETQATYWTTTWKESAVILLAGIEHFVSENFSLDIRITGSRGEENYTHMGEYEHISEWIRSWQLVGVDFGISIFLS